MRFAKDHSLKWIAIVIPFVSVGALKGATHGRFAGGIFWFFCTLAPFWGHLCYSLSVTDPVGALAPFETFSRELSR